MLCCVHLTVNLWVSSKYYGFLYLSRCLIFKVLRTFWKVFCRFLPNLSQQCVNYYITFIFVCQHFFSKFLKSFLKSLSLLLKAFFCAFKLFCCLCFPQATLLLYHNYTESQYLFKFLLTNQFVFSTYILYKMLHLSIIFYKYDIFYLYQDNLSTKTIILILLTSL